MAITQTIVLTVNKFDIALSTPISLFKHDNIKLVFRIRKSNIDRKEMGITGCPLGLLNCLLFIENEDNFIKVESIRSNEDSISFNLTSRETNLTGILKAQIVIKDDDGCQVTLPPFEIEVREPLYDENGVATVGTFNCGTLNVGQGLSQEVINDVIKEVRCEISKNIEEDIMKTAMIEVIREKQDQDELQRVMIKNAIKEVVTNIEGEVKKEVVKESVKELLSNTEEPLIGIEKFETPQMSSALSDNFKKKLKKVGD